MEVEEGVMEFEESIMEVKKSILYEQVHWGTVYVV